MVTTPSNNGTSEQQIMAARYTVPYNWCAQRSSRMWRQKNGLWKLAHELSGNLRGHTVLDAGCGDGWYTAHMTDEASEVHGIDLSENAIEFAQSINKHATFVSGSLLSLPYKDETFTRIFSFQVIEHIPPDDLKVATRELSRVLKDDGILIVTVPSVNRPMSRAHFQHFTVQSLDEVLHKHFVPVEHVGQERHTSALHIIERLLHNRAWLLPELAERFNKTTFLARWNKTTADTGQNIVATYIKKKS